MDAYEQLREHAKSIRDRAIKSARADYSVAIRRINTLRHQLTGEAPGRGKRGDGTLTRRLVELLPKDAPFTSTQLVELMHADAEGRQFASNSIISALPKLVAAGTVRRVGRKNGHVLWAYQTLEVENECPFAGATVADIVAQLIKERGPMRVNEIVVAMKERGYRPDEKSQQTTSNVRRAITRFTGRFERGNDGRWAVAD